VPSTTAVSTFTAQRAEISVNGAVRPWLWDTSTGEEWEAFSLDSVTEAFDGYDRFGVAGNHDHGSFVTDYLADRGWTMLGGSVVVESVFAWPGLGQLAFQSLFARDFNLLLGIFFLSACLVVLVNLVVDLVYTILDPRIQVG